MKRVYCRQIKSPATGCLWEGKVYVGKLDGFSGCLDAATGTLTWKSDTFIGAAYFILLPYHPDSKRQSSDRYPGAEFGVYAILFFVTKYSNCTCRISPVTPGNYNAKKHCDAIIDRRCFSIHLLPANKRTLMHSSAAVAQRNACE